MSSSITASQGSIASQEGGVSDVASLKTRIKALQAEKGEIAGQFKQPSLGAAERDALKLSMKGVSQALNAAQAELKSLLNQPAAPAVSPPVFPAQFTPASQSLGRPVEVRRLLPAEYALWAEFVAGQAGASAYHHPAYLAHIERVFGHASLVLGAFDQGALVGGLPITLMRSRLFGEFGVSVPYFNYGGPLTSYTDVMQALLEGAHALLADEKLSHIEVRTTQPELSLPCNTKKVSMILALPTTEAELDDQLGAKVRAQYKKAEEHQPHVIFGGLALLDDFYGVFAINMRDLGTPVYSKSWFRALLEDDRLNTTLVVGYLEGKPVSTGFLLGHGEMLEIPWASTLRSVNATNINMWLYRQMLGYAIEQGYRYFDLGRSTQGAGTYQFKKQWGARPVQHYWYSVSNTGAVSETNPDNPKYRLLIAVWQRLPVWLTRLIGPPVIKNVP